MHQMKRLYTGRQEALITLNIRATRLVWLCKIIIIVTYGSQNNYITQTQWISHKSKLSEKEVLLTTSGKNDKIRL